MRIDYSKFSQDVLGLIEQTPSGQRTNPDEDSPTPQAPLGTCRKLSLATAEPPGLEAGSVVEVMSVPPERLGYGDLVCALQSGQARIGRLLRREGGTLLVARAGKLEAIPTRQVLGRIVRARQRGRDFNPARQNPLVALFNRLTDFGTFHRFRPRASKQSA